MRVLIVEDGYQRGAVTAVRALRKTGWTVGVASPVEGHAARSRHCAVWHRAAQPADGIESFERDLSRSARKTRRLPTKRGQCRDDVLHFVEHR